jgi:hypothetical protein
MDSSSTVIVTSPPLHSSSTVIPQTEVEAARWTITLQGAPKQQFSLSGLGYTSSVLWPGERFDMLTCVTFAAAAPRGHPP